jgi:protein tyrosine phosphatase
VKLKDAQGETDYINANFVECPQAKRKYILAQGPLKNTCEHFWQMIWEQNTKGIIMLNKLYEKGSVRQIIFLFKDKLESLINKN